jgi:hypothetical protein
LYYYGALAFVAGFSERFTRVLAKSVEGLVPAQGADDEASHEPARREEERDPCARARGSAGSGSS